MQSTVLPLSRAVPSSSAQEPCVIDVPKNERQVKSLMRRAPSTSSTPQASVPGLKVRFVAKGLRSSPRPGPIRGRSREGAGLSARSVYNWESGKARLRHDQIAKLSQLRKAGKHQVVAFLPQQGRTQGKAATQ